NQLSERYEERYNELFEVMRQLGEQNQQQAEELARVHKRMDEQNANISVILREVLDTRRMVAAANDKRWWEFWKKDMVLPDLDDPEVRWKLSKDK
ncbi:DUF3967 domain-containing protein, partial [Paenibacillus sp. FSL H7-0714]|uniref:DUF3967 domain-containing protein n=1 Tax=Paenibacillus sp. FSL H7-0714 TaxID=2954735 RepID=UPI0030F5D1BB